MSQTTITTRITSQDKAAFDLFCQDVGLTPSSAINIFIKKVIHEQKIPFEISVNSDPFFSEPNLSILKQSVRQLRSGKGTAHELIEVEDE